MSNVKNDDIAHPHPGDRLFIGVYPCGLVYADRHREKCGDYVRLGFLSYRTLVLDLEPDCPPDLRIEIEYDTAKLQARKGEHFEVSTSGQTVLLGESL